MELITVFYGLTAVLVIWLNLLATIAVKYDYTLAPFQKNAQILFVWVLPVIGASFILRLVFEHSPNAIPKSWIPWPFKSLVYSKAVNHGSSRDENERDVYTGQSANNGKNDVRGDVGNGGD